MFCSTDQGGPQQVTSYAESGVTVDYYLVFCTFLFIFFPSFFLNNLPEQFYSFQGFLLLEELYALALAGYLSHEGENLGKE